MEEEEEDVEELAETPREGEEGGAAPPLSTAASESLVEDEREAEGHTGKEQEQVCLLASSVHPVASLGLLLHQTPSLYFSPRDGGPSGYSIWIFPGWTSKIALAICPQYYSKAGALVMEFHMLRTLPALGLIWKSKQKVLKTPFLDCHARFEPASC